MKPRQTLVECFSTFLQWDQDQFSGWSTDSKLRRNIQKCLAQSPNLKNDTFWALYWHKVWQMQTDAFASQHLAAYLQEACYWVAKKTKLQSTTQQSLADLFQAAIARIESILKGFDAQYGSSLKSYAEKAFHNIIRDTLRQQQEVDICTDWGLLRKLSHKRLVLSLEREGLNRSTIDHYVFAWECFNRCYVPEPGNVTRKLPKPSPSVWQAISTLYNREQLSQLDSSAPTGSPENLEKWMNTCVRAVRNFLYPKVTSIDAPKSGQDTGELLDNLTVGFHESLLTELIAQIEAEDRQAQRTQLIEVLTCALTELDAGAQHLLQAYYGEGLTQAQIAQDLKLEQYKISRQLASLRRSLLLSLAQWSQMTLHISLTSDVLTSMSTVLEEWLQIHYRRPNHDSQEEPT